MSNWVYKTSVSELKELDEVKGYVEAYANVYNLKDSHSDNSLPGSFLKTVKERAGRIFVYKNHDDNLLVGVPKLIDATDQYGLFTGTQFNMDTDIGKNTLLDVKFMIDNGVPPPVSVGVWITKRDKSNVIEQKLKEYSFLTKEQSNPLSVATSIKSAKDGINIVDMVIKMYDIPYSDARLKQLEQILMSLDEKPNGEGLITPIDGTTLKDEPTMSNKSFFQILTSR
ncbi:HK97 family phage prohead protease [Sphingobacterium faecium]|uniref:HK97 family phage prohead protease n=1 Tax=Sphingobacterium faecium TaxID=34087 RepID=UPI0024688515|nr:HK97 family phage prohead protease [Sphingobacterium faecium]MDH5825763.1 HK97 family phage prohead protease [Sphingobacterium faecium]